MHHLTLIADYGTDSLATAEAVAAIRRSTTQPFSFDVVAARSFNTLHTGFLLAQLHEHLLPNNGTGTIFFLNTDPRTQTSKGVERAEGSPLVHVTLSSGAQVVTPLAGHCLSLVKPHVAQLHIIPSKAAGSQFRSRDLFPQIVGRAIDGTIAKCLGESMDRERILNAPSGYHVLHIDNYGNVKTSFTERDRAALRVEWETDVRIHLADEDVLVPLVKNIFARPAGTLVFAPGSSGDPTNPYFELSVRFAGNPQQSAGAVFRWPEPGSALRVHAHTPAQA